MNYGPPDVDVVGSIKVKDGLFFGDEFASQVYLNRI